MNTRDNQFDNHIKQQLEAITPPEPNGHWEAFEQELLAEGLTDSTYIDEEILDQLRGYEAAPILGDWDVMANILDEADLNEIDAFDQKVKGQVENYEAPYEPKTWPILADKLALAEARRTRLITAKILEVACLLLLIFTIINLNVVDRFLNKKNVEESNRYNEAITEIEGIKPSFEIQDISGVQLEADLIGEDVFNAEQTLVSSTNVNNQTFTDNSIQRNQLKSNFTISQSNASTIRKIENTNLEKVENKLSTTEIVSMANNFEEDGEILNFNTSLDSNQSITSRFFTYNALSFLPRKTLTAPFLRGQISLLSLISPIRDAIQLPLFLNANTESIFNGITPSITPKRSNLRVGLRTSADIDFLYFPEDHFYSAGDRIDFGAQTVPALGYGGGITIGWFGDRFGFEAGFNYSSKSFKPGRQFLIGESILTSSKVDFAGVQIDVLSLPAHMTYHVKPNGTFRVYGIAGVDFNLITQANYDLFITNNIPENLRLFFDPQAEKTAKEARRVREHLLDGAEFSSKSFVTIHTGFGMEKYLNPDLSLFAEPTYIYQLPTIFNGRNGNHLQSVSIQFGARMPLK